MAEREYEGGELQLFARAEHWKTYWAAAVAPFMRGRVLDVGAGIGATARALASSGWTTWTALEPDPVLCAGIRRAIDNGELPSSIEVINGTLDDLPASDPFETILYMDVLEHILEDRNELDQAAARLAPGGHLVVLAPAHQWLYSPFDAAVGHHRRYTRGSLTEIAPRGLRVVRAWYLDSAGLLASLANRLLLRSAMPTPAQIALWDRVLVPTSTVLDRLLLRLVGKSVLVVLCAPPATGAGVVSPPSTKVDIHHA